MIRKDIRSSTESIFLLIIGERSRRESDVSYYSNDLMRKLTYYRTVNVLTNRGGSVITAVFLTFMDWLNITQSTIAHPNEQVFHDDKLLY